MNGNDFVEHFENKCEGVCLYCEDDSDVFPKRSCPFRKEVELENESETNEGKNT